MSRDTLRRVLWRGSCSVIWQWAAAIPGSSQDIRSLLPVFRSAPPKNKSATMGLGMGTTAGLFLLKELNEEPLCVFLSLAVHAEQM